MLHNDTINVWTHLLGACYFIASSPFIMSGSWTEPGAVQLPASTAAFSLLHRNAGQLHRPGQRADVHVHLERLHLPLLVCCIPRPCWLPIRVSRILALIRCPHPPQTFRGSDLSTYKAFYRLDLTGIVILIAGSNFVGMYNAFIETSPLLVLVYLVPVSVLLSVAVYLTNAASCQGVEYDKVRVLTLAGSVAVGGVPIAHWLWAAQGDACFPYALWPVVGLGLSYATGFLIFYFRIPECFFPGRLDILASSHQFWHVLVFVAAYCWLHGMVSVFQCRIDGPSALSGLPELGA